MLDILFKNISIVDGSGSPARIGDVGVCAGKITYKTNDEAKIVVNGDGLTLCPGFIDVHSHGDFSVGFYPSTICKISQGVTTEIAGNCGDSTFPVDLDHLEDLKLFASMTHDFYNMPYKEFVDFNGFAGYCEKVGMSMNMGVLVGHNMLRASVMGSANRKPTAEEMEQMKQRLRTCMEQGAMGFSTGLVYMPGVFADLDELVELTKVIAPYGGIYATHMRDESDDVIESVKEAIYIAEQAGVPLQISHLKVRGKKNWGKSKEMFRLIYEARERGVQILHDLYPYDASVSGISVCIPPKYYENGMDALLEKLKDPTFRSHVAAEMSDPNCGYDNFYLCCGGFGGMLISSSTAVPKAEGLTVQQYAEKVCCDPMDAFFDLLVQNKGTVQGIFFAMDQKEVETFYCDPYSVTGSDGVCWDVKRKCHPRTWNTFIRTLTHFAEERKLVSFEEAVMKQTGLTAKFWNLEGKGLIAEGYDADLVLVDRSKLGTTATYADPNKKADGIEAVYVGGEIAYFEKEVTDVRNGHILRMAKKS